MPGIGVEEVEAGEIVRAVDRLYRDAFGRQPRRRRAGRRQAGIGESDLAKSGILAHYNRESAHDSCIISWPRLAGQS